ncbi:MAG: hypothetical protein DMG01_30440, partial [Acidobacteria bacterium]
MSVSGALSLVARVSAGVPAVPAAGVLVPPVLVTPSSRVHPNDKAATTAHPISIVLFSFIIML